MSHVEIVYVNSGPKSSVQSNVRVRQNFGDNKGHFLPHIVSA